MKISLSEHTLDIDLAKCDDKLLDLSELEDYIRALAGEREYQYKAIREILVYLWGGAYGNLADLARENFARKPAIQQRFQSESHFLGMLPLPDRLSGVCHMATGTGKSYVMFAIAHLSVLLDKVKRVLILGPSSTVIESGLRGKFKEYLYGEKGAELKARLPERLRHKVIRLLTCNDPIEDHSIVIENVNAIYDRDRNSIGDTLFNHKGEVLVLSDEVHHAYSHLDFAGDSVAYDFKEGGEGRGDERDERLWMKFIREEKAITRHIGFTGTPYNANDYFPDVICNYSIKDAIDEKVIKLINPILKTESDEIENELTLQQRFEQIIATHVENSRKYAYAAVRGKRRVKPITIFIHPTQAAAQKNADAFIQTLGEHLKQTEEKYSGMARSALEQAARERVICVVSRLAESEYKQKLDEIEETDPAKVGGGVEFIFAVNKLSEGWDVDNVFQIVPAAQRVFNSKLLISQVLGRGLRLPRDVPFAELAANYPVVTVTNHEKFARHIMELVDEVTECEMRLISNPIKDERQKRHEHHFNVFNLEYLPSQRLEDRPQEEGGAKRALKLTPSPEKLGLRVVYLQDIKRFELSKDFFTVDHVVRDIERRFANTVFESTHFDFGDGLIVEDIPGQAEIEKVIRAAMAKGGIKGDLLSRENRQQIDLYFYQFLPKATHRVVRENILGSVKGAATNGMQQAGARSGALANEMSVFVCEDFESELDDQNLFVLRELTRPPKQKTFDEAWLPAMQGFDKNCIRQMIPNKHLYAVKPCACPTKCA